MKINEDQKVTLTVGQLKRLISESTTKFDSTWYKKASGRKQMAIAIMNWIANKKAVDSCSCEIRKIPDGRFIFYLDVDIDIAYTGYSQHRRSTWDDDDVKSTEYFLEYVDKCPFIRKYILPIMPCDEEHWCISLNQTNTPIDVREVADYMNADYIKH